MSKKKRKLPKVIYVKLVDDGGPRLWASPEKELIMCDEPIGDPVRIGVYHRADVITLEMKVKQQR